MIKQTLLAVAVLILVGGFVLVWDSPPDAFLRDKPGEVDDVPEVDAFMSDVTSDLYAADGARRYRLSSANVEMYEYQQILKLQKPRLFANNQEGQITTLAANAGWLSVTLEKLQLTGDVRMENSQENQSSLLLTQQLDYLIGNQTLATEKEFHLLNGGADIRGVGLTADLANQRYQIASKVRVSHEPI